MTSPQYDALNTCNRSCRAFQSQDDIRALVAAVAVLADASARIAAGDLGATGLAAAMRRVIANLIGPAEVLQ